MLKVKAIVLKSELLIYRYSGDTIVPRRLPINNATIALAIELIDAFTAAVQKQQKELDEKLAQLEGDSPEYRVRRGSILLGVLSLNRFCSLCRERNREAVALRARGDEEQGCGGEMKSLFICSVI